MKKCEFLAKQQKQEQDNILAQARRLAGWRERYAMDNCENPRFVPNGDTTLLIFNYNKDLPFQDGNGATFDTGRLVWVG